MTDAEELESFRAEAQEERERAERAEFRAGQLADRVNALTEELRALRESMRKFSGWPVSVVLGAIAERDPGGQFVLVRDGRGNGGTVIVPGKWVAGISGLAQARGEHMGEAIAKFLGVDYE